MARKGSPKRRCKKCKKLTNEASMFGDICSKCYRAKASPKR